MKIRIIILKTSISKKSHKFRNQVKLIAFNNCKILRILQLKEQEGTPWFKELINKFKIIKSDILSLKQIHLLLKRKRLNPKTFFCLHNDLFIIN